MDLQAAEKENNLRNEPQIIAFKNAIKAKHNLMKQQADVEAAKAEFTPEQQAEIDQVIAEKGPVRNTAGANGKLDDDEFWKAFEIIVTLQIRYQHRAIHDNASERRALLLSNQQPQYESIVQEMLEDIEKSKGQLGTAILGALSIEPNLYDRSAQLINSTQETKAKASQIVSRVEIAERSKLMGEGSKALSKAEGLKRIKQIEQKKGEIMTEILLAV